MCRGDDFFRVFTGGCIRARRRDQPLRRHQDDSQHVAEIVGDLAGNYSDRLDPLGVLEAAPELFPIALAARRDVLGNADDVAWPAGAEDHSALAFQDADAVWRAEDFRFARIIAAAGDEDIAIPGDQDFSLLVREDVVIGFAEHLIARHTEEIFARLVEQDEAQLVGILYPDHVRDRIDDPVYQLVAEPAWPLARLTVIRACEIACHHAYPTPHKRLDERSGVGQKSLWHRAPFWMHWAPHARQLHQAAVLRYSCGVIPVQRRNDRNSVLGSEYPRRYATSSVECAGSRSIADAMARRISSTSRWSEVPSAASRRCSVLVGTFISAATRESVGFPSASMFQIAERTRSLVVLPVVSERSTCSASWVRYPASASSLCRVGNDMSCSRNTNFDMGWPNRSGQRKKRWCSRVLPRCS